MNFLHFKAETKFIYDGIFGYEHICPKSSHFIITEGGNKYEFFKDMEGKSAGFINTFFTKVQSDAVVRAKSLDAAKVIESFKHRIP
jgi:hypothetical protein